MIKSLISVFSSMCLAGCTMMGIRNSEEAAYTLISTDGNIEIRRYESLWVAETLIKADYTSSGGIGFKRLAGYIFGDNQQQQKMAMTTPVFREPVSENIGITQPIYLQAEASGLWLMRFVMPAGYNLDSLPLPSTAEVEIKEIPAKKVAVICFSGQLNLASITEKTHTLVEWLNQQSLPIKSVPRSAAYDPPWTIPMLRRNEVHIDID